MARCFLLIYYLLWCFNSNSSIPVGNRGTFQTPSSSSDQRISSIQSELQKVKTKIEDLNTALISGNVTEDVKTRLSGLEAQFQNLKQQLLDERRESAAENGKYDSSINELTNYLNTNDKQLKELEATMKKKAQDEADRRLPAEAAEAIRNHRFLQAEAILLKMGNTNIPNIIHEVYANSPASTDLIIDFAKTLADIETRFHVLNALRYEMKLNGHQDPYKLIQLVKTLESEVINQPKCTPYYKKESEKLVRETKEDIIAATTEILLAAVYANKYQKNVEVEKLANYIDDYDRKISDEVIRQVVSKSFSLVDPVQLANDMFSNRYLPQMVEGLVTLYYKLDKANALGNTATKVILSDLVWIKKTNNYIHLSESKKNALNTILEKHSEPAFATAFMRGLSVVFNPFQFFG